MDLERANGLISMAICAGSASVPVRLWLDDTRRRIVDRGARTTLGNAIVVGRAARRLGVSDVLLVTSRWHARRASVLVRASLRGTGTRLSVATSAETPPPVRRLRELAAWSVVPLLAVVAAWTR